MVWSETPITHPQAIYVLESIDDLMSATVRTAMANFVGDRTFPAGTRWRDALTDMLRNPPAKWKGLIPTNAGRYELWFGPGGPGQNLLYEEQTTSRHASKDMQDSFDRANANLAGSTSSDTQFTWSETQGTGWTITSNEAQVTGNVGFCVAMASLDMDTADHYAEATIGTYTYANSTLSVGVLAMMRFGTNAAGEEGYGFEVGNSSVGAFARRIYNFEDDVALANDTVQTTTGTIRIEMTGSTVRGKVNGVTVFGPATDADAWQTYRKTGLTIFCNSTNTFGFASFRAADLVSITWDQAVYRWRDDDGDELTASPLAAENTPITRETGLLTRLRTLLNPAGGDPASTQIQREWNRALADSVWRPLQAIGGGALAFGTAGATTTAGTTTGSVAFPTGILKGELLVLYAGNRPSASTFATPAGWTLMATATGGAGAEAADTGIMRGTVFTKEADGTETGNLTVTITGGTSIGAKILRYTKTTGKVWDVAIATGADNTAGTSWSATAASNPGVTAGDILLICSCSSTDTATVTVPVVTQTGVTAFGAATVRDTTAVGTGNDQRVIIVEFPVTTGTGSAAPVYTMTMSAATAAGVSLFLRIRQIDAPLVLAVSPNIAAGGTTNTTAQLPPPGGTFGGGKISDDTNPFPACGPCHQHIRGMGDLPASNRDGPSRRGIYLQGYAERDAADHV